MRASSSRAGDKGTTVRERDDRTDDPRVEGIQADGPEADGPREDGVRADRVRADRAMQLQMEEDHLADQPTDRGKSRG